MEAHHGIAGAAECSGSRRTCLYHVTRTLIGKFISGETRRQAEHSHQFTLRTETTCEARHLPQAINHDSMKHLGLMKFNAVESPQNSVRIKCRRLPF